MALLVIALSKKTSISTLEQNPGKALCVGFVCVDAP